MPKDESVGATNSEDFVVTFRDQNAFIELDQPYEFIAHNSPSRLIREVDSDWGELSNCLSSLAQSICAILLVFGAAIIFSISYSLICHIRT